MQMKKKPPLLAWLSELGEFWELGDLDELGEVGELDELGQSVHNPLQYNTVYNTDEKETTRSSYLSWRKEETWKKSESTADVEHCRIIWSFDSC